MSDTDVSTAAQVVRLAVVSSQPIHAADHDAAVNHPAGGARVVFDGVVRDHDHGRTVVELEYQGHPSAQTVLAEVVREFAASPGVLAIAVSHRVGLLGIGDSAFVAAVAAAHRREAFDICSRLVDEVKSRLPIWKRQVFDDGTDEWVNCP